MEICQSLVLSLEGRTPGQIWNGLSSACRRAVRKAEKSGIIILDECDSRFVEDYYPICQHVYRGSGRLPHLSKEFYSTAWEILIPRGSIKALLAVHADQIVAGAIFLLFRKTAYYLSGASYDKAHSMRPNNLLQWKFIEWAVSNGYHTYDMGGVVVPGITRFKQSFGAQFTTYTRIYRANSTIARLGRAAYKYFIPLWRRLSSLITNANF